MGRAQALAEEILEWAGFELTVLSAMARDEGIDGSCWFLSQEGFEFGERHLDRVQVWAVRRQVEELGPPGGDGLADACDPVSGQVVEHDNVAAVAAAINYMLNNWPGFTAFLDDGRVCMTKNAAERAMRGIALGRKA